MHNCYTKTAIALVETQLLGEGEDDEDEFDEARIEIAEHRQGRNLPISTLTNLFLKPRSSHRDKGFGISREDRSSDSQGGQTFPFCPQCIKGTRGPSFENISCLQHSNLRRVYSSSLESAYPVIPRTFPYLAPSSSLRNPFNL